MKRLEFTKERASLMHRMLGCLPGKGILLTTPERRSAASLVRAGLVEWIEGGGIRVYRATEKARKEYPQYPLAQPTPEPTP